MTQFLCVISYDIANDKRRTRMQRLLAAHGSRVQYSVFECLLSMQLLGELRRACAAVIDSQTDSVRYYPLSADCRARIVTQGCGALPLDEDDPVIV